MKHRGRQQVPEVSRARDAILMRACDSIQRAPAQRYFRNTDQMIHSLQDLSTIFQRSTILLKYSNTKGHLDESNKNPYLNYLTFLERKKGRKRLRKIAIPEETRERISIGDEIQRQKGGTCIPISVTVVDPRDRIDKFVNLSTNLVLRFIPAWHDDESFLFKTDFFKTTFESREIFENPP